MKTKSQLRVKFITTYGWLIAVFLIIIPMLDYSHILSFSAFLPNRCVLVYGLTCLGFKVEPNQIALEIGNHVEKPITIKNVDIANCSGAFDTKIMNGDKSAFVITDCNNGASGDLFKGDIVIGYTEKQTAQTKIIKGYIKTKVE